MDLPAILNNSPSEFSKELIEKFAGMLGISVKDLGYGLWYNMYTRGINIVCHIQCSLVKRKKLIIEITFNLITLVFTWVNVWR